MARGICFMGANTNDQNLKNAAWRYGVRFVPDANATIYRFFISFKALGASGFPDQPSGSQGYGKGDGGTLGFQIVNVKANGDPNLASVLPNASEVVGASTRYASIKANYGIGTISGAVYADFPAGVAVTGGSMYAFVVRNTHADPLNNYFSINSVDMKASAAGPQNFNNLDPNYPNPVGRMDAREVACWSTNTGSTWVYGVNVGAGYYEGSPTSDDGCRIPLFGYSTSPGNVRPQKPVQPYSAYSFLKNTGGTQTFPVAPRAVTLTKAGGYAAIGNTVGVVTVTNTSTGVSGTTASLGTGMAIGPLTPNVPVAVGQTYTCRASGTVFINAVDNWVVALWGAGVAGGLLPFRSTLANPVHRIGVFATPDPWLTDPAPTTDPDPPPDTAVTMTAKLWNNATGVEARTIANGNTILESEIPADYDIQAFPSAAVGSIKFTFGAAEATTTPAFRSASDSLGTGANITPAEPAGAAQGDVFVACFIGEAVGTLGLPAGWTSLYSGTSLSAGNFDYIVGRIVRGASAPDLTFTCSQGLFRQVTVFAFSGVDNTTPVNASTSVTVQATNPDPPSANATVADTLALAISCHWGGANPFVPPSGYTLRGNTGNTDIGGATKQLTASGAENPGTFTGPAGLNDTASFTVLLQPVLDTVDDLVRSETTAPYTLDDGSVAGKSFTLGVGAKILTMQAYTGAGGTGTLQGTTTINFAVAADPPVDPDPPPTPTVTMTAQLWDDTTDTGVLTIGNGSQLLTTDIPADYDIIVNPSSAVGSIKMTYGAYVHTETTAPYTLDDTTVGGEQFSLAVGSYSLIMEAWSGAGATGSVLGTNTVNFTVAAPAVASTAFNLSATLTDSGAPVRSLTNGDSFPASVVPAAYDIVISATEASIPERFAMMINTNAWAAEDPTAAAGVLEGAIFHAAEQVSPDETARIAFRAADPDAVDTIYFNFGMAVTNPAWTTAVSVTAASTAGPGGTSFLAQYGGATAGPPAYTSLTSIDHGKAGWGEYFASFALSKLAVLSTKPRAVFFDDVNVADNRLPAGTGSGTTGVPDAYATSQAYANAIRTQLILARDAFRAAGYMVVANVGGISEWQTFYFPANDLANVCDYTLIEFAGMFSNQAVVDSIAWPRIIAAGALGNLMAQTFGSTEPRARFNDYWARILGAKAAIFSNDNDYAGPIVDHPFFHYTYGAPTGPAVLDGSEASRTFSNGTTLTVDLSTFAASSTGPGGSADVVGSIKMTFDSSYVRTENVAPYTLDDTSVAGIGFALGAGVHTLIMEAWSGAGATGTLLTTKTITFTITAPPAPTGFPRRVAGLGVGRPMKFDGAVMVDHTAKLD